MEHPPILVPEVVVGVLAVTLVLGVLPLVKLDPTAVYPAPVMFVLGVAAADLCFLLAYLWRVYEIPVQPPLGVADADEHTDNPKHTIEEDTLDRAGFVKDLADRVASQKGPYVFGLDGPWGEGKTSVLYMLYNHLVESADFDTDRPIVVYFDPWNYPEKEPMASGLCKEISGTIEKLYALSDFRQTYSRYASYLAAGLALTGRRVSLEPPPATLADARKSVQDTLDLVGRNVVVLVDDLDRLGRDELLTACKMVRLAASFERVVFVLAYDARAVAATLREEPEGTRKNREFATGMLDKVVQCPLALPSAEPARVQAYLFKRLGDSFQEAGIPATDYMKGISEFGHRHSTYLMQSFRTLRRVKRFIDSLRGSLGGTWEHVNLGDLLLVQYLSAFEPYIHEEVWLHPWFYTDCTENTEFSGVVLPWETRNTTEILKRRREHADAVVQQSNAPEVTMSILRDLFPLLSPERTQGLSQVEKDELRGSLRLAHGKHFHCYFMHRTRIGQLPDSQVIRLVEGWTTTPDDPYPKIHSALKTHAESGMLRQLVEALTVRTAKLKSHVRDALAAGLCQTDYSVLAGPDADQTLDAASGLYWALWELRIPGPRLQREAVDLVTRALSAAFLAAAALRKRGKPAQEDHDAQRLRFHLLGEAARRHLEETSKATHQDISRRKHHIEQLFRLHERSPDAGAALNQAMRKDAVSLAALLPPLLQWLKEHNLPPHQSDLTRRQSSQQLDQSHGLNLSGLAELAKAMLGEPVTRDSEDEAVLRKFLKAVDGLK